MNHTRFNATCQFCRAPQHALSEPALRIRATKHLRSCSAFASELRLLGATADKEQVIAGLLDKAGFPPEATP